jgi:DNA-directed RNA polymerase specialized sigma24 family protein
LLDRLWQGQDEEAWTEFVGLYGPLIFTFDRRRLPQDDDAADVMQEVFRAVLKRTYHRPEGALPEVVGDRGLRAGCIQV